MSLEAGEGHICDRCGAEHAIVYVVEDTDTLKTYSVGSTCAKASFGFDVSKDVETKRLIKTAKQKAAKELDDQRQLMVAAAAKQLASEVGSLEVPPFTINPGDYKFGTRWDCGDAYAIAAFGRTDTEAQKIALMTWYEHRLRERIPPEWHRVEVLYNPSRKSNHTIDMGRKTIQTAMHLIAGCPRL